MKCPLFTAAEIAHEPEFKPSSNNCLGEECAWWNSKLEACSMVALVINIGSLAELLSVVAAKIPHEGQLRK